eukprot:jgi/Mesvir1/10071/Mv05552-RA.1
MVSIFRRVLFPTTAPVVATDKKAPIAASLSPSKSPWDRDVYIVGRQRPHQSVLGICDMEKDRKTHVVRPMTHILGFNDERLASSMEKLAIRDHAMGEDNKWCLDDDSVDKFIVERIEEIGYSSYESDSLPCDISVKSLKFRKLIQWSALAGLVLRMVDLVDDKVVITTHYPSEDEKVFIPYLNVCLK